MYRKSTVQCEQLFRNAGRPNTVNKTRSSLEPNTVNMLVSSVDI